MLAILLVFTLAGCGDTDKTKETAAPADTGYDEGDMLPDFSVPLAGGGTFTLSEHSGKPVFINLFATWCGPCKAEMPDIEQLYGEYGDRVTFIAIDIGEDEAIAQDFKNSNEYTLPFAYAENGAPFEGYSIQSIPHTFILNADGIIATHFARAWDYDTLKAAIDKVAQ